MSCPVPPKTTGAPGEAGASETTLTVNQVERRPRAERTFADSMVDSPSAPIAVTDATRPEAFGVVCTSSSRPGLFSAFATFAAGSAIGPQSWYGEIESYGSGTETRYGIGVPHASSAASVRPPEVE